MASRRITRTFRFAPYRVLLPLGLVLLLFAGSIFLYLLPALEKALLDSKKEFLTHMVGSVINTLDHLEMQVQKGDLTREEAQSQAKDFIRGMRYGPDQRDYYWISDHDAIMVMHPYRPDLDGLDLSEFRDKSGTYIFREFADLVKEDGDGYLNYYWQWKDHPERLARKLSYLREFKPWGWILGTGLYLDDVEEAITIYRDRISVIFVAIILASALLSLYVIRQSALSEKRRAYVQTQRERLVGVLKESEERYRTIADFGHDWGLWISPENTILYCSPASERITGYPPEKFFENPDLVRDIIIEEDREEWDRYAQAANSEMGDSLDYRIRAADGSMRWIGAVGRSVSGIGGKPLGLRLSFRDITERKHMEEQLRHQALHDPLTNLANRTLCLDRISQAMHRAVRRENYYFAVVFMDLDRFKIINDSLGHRFGDLVLSETASRLSTEMRGLDTVARFGGDEFVLLLDELSSPGEAIRIIKRVRQTMAVPFRFHGNEVQTTASFGIVLSPVADIKPADVLQHANIAMHRAKEAGRNRFKVFTGRMLETAVDQMTMENDMRRGLESDEFFVTYQPIMDLNGSEIVGFEALARWDHPKRGIISPAEFIPLAEETGLIIQLGESVLRKALETLALWRKDFPDAENLFMSVNLSSKQFARIELDKMVVRTLNELGLPASALKLEITESAIMDNPESSINTLKRLRRAGVRFSIDDFGTGYSSLSQLQKLPVDTLKVDRSFISRMKTDPENMEIVRAVIALAHSLDLDVIAEGVEESGQLCSLMDLNCEGVQGFYFHEPLDTEDAFALLQARSKEGGSPSRAKLLKTKRECNEE